MNTREMEIRTITSGPDTGKVKSVLLWSLQILLAVNFLFAGGGKLAGMEQMVMMFDEVGIGQWFRYFTGILEVGFALLLLIPRKAFLGALGLSVVMAGAVITELFIIAGNPVMPLVLLVLLMAVAVGRRVR